MGNNFFPCYLILVLKSLNNKIYYSWPTPFVVEIVDWEENHKSLDKEFIPENNNKTVYMDTEHPTRDNILIAFSLADEANDVGIFSVKEMYIHLEKLLTSDSLTITQFEIVRGLFENFYKNELDDS